MIRMRGWTSCASLVGALLGIASWAPAASSAQQIEAAAQEPITFTRHVAPLVFDRCASCHRPEGPAPFSLLSYQAVRQRATQIAVVTRSRFMPPWKAEAGHAEFIGQKPLTHAEIELIDRWVKGGAVEGDARDLPPVPRRTGEWQLGTPDLVVALPQPYTLAAEGADVFRTFVVRVPTNAVRYVRGLEFRASNPRVVHHANIRVDRTPASRDLDARDPSPGYDGAMAHSAEFPDGHFLAWTPGQVAPLLPKGLAWRLDPGTDLVFQLHMQPSGKPEVVQASIGLFFGSDPPERTPLILRLARQDIDIPPGEANHVIEDSYQLPVDVEVQAVQPHAHTRARDVRAIATLPDGSTRVLLSIKDWDFRWQHVYRYTTPIALPKGTTVSMRYTYDNSAANPRNPVQPPQRVGYGWQTADEMSEMYVQVLTRTEAERDLLGRSFQRKSIAEDILGYEGIIRRDGPAAAGLHDDVALLYLELGRVEEAIGHLEAAVRLQPREAFTRFNLGIALKLAGRLDEAVREFAEAIRIQPDHALAHNQLGSVYSQQGRPDDALRHYREAVRVAPQHAAAHNNLGVALMQRGELDEAAAQFEHTLRLDPGSADAHYNLGHLMKQRGNLAGAVAHFERAVELTRAGDARAVEALSDARRERQQQRR